MSAQLSPRQMREQRGNPILEGGDKDPAVVITFFYETVLRWVFTVGDTWQMLNWQGVVLDVPASTYFKLDSGSDPAPILDTDIEVSRSDIESCAPSKAKRQSRPGVGSAHTAGSSTAAVRAPPAHRR